MNKLRLWCVGSQTLSGQYIAYMTMAETGREAIRKAKRSRWRFVAAKRWTAISAEGMRGREYSAIWFSESSSINTEWNLL